MESGGESSELLRPGDLGITISAQAGEPHLGLDAIVKVCEAPESMTAYGCYRVTKFPLGGETHAVAASWLKLFWRPSASDSL